MSLKRFTADRAGATAIEYAIIAGFVGIVIVAALANIGGELTGIFSDAEAGLKKRSG